jgi:hypothetical protein
MSVFADFIAAEANNLEISRDRFGSAVTLLGVLDDTAGALIDMVREHPGDDFGQTFEVEWHLLNATRTELFIAGVSALRGHLTTSGQITRRLLELTATAWRLHRYPDLLALWLVEHNETGWRERRDAFGTRKLFPDDDATIHPLYERYELLNALVHSSATSLARRHLVSIDGNAHVHKANVFELEDGDQHEPIRTLLYLAQTYSMVLDVFAAAWMPYFGPRVEKWTATRAVLRADLQLHLDRYAMTCREP